MGCSSSSPGPGPPRNLPQHRPPPGPPRSNVQWKTEHLAGLQLTEYKGIRPSTLDDSLKYAANTLAKQRKNVTIIASGGIVDIYGLNHRHLLHDLLFFGDHLEQGAKEDLQSAMKAAQESYGAPVYDSFFNTESIQRMGFDLQKQLTGIAWRNPWKLFSQPGLTVLAPPAAYLLACKLSRLGTANERQYDLDDAVGYLRICINGLDKKAGVNLPVGLEWIGYTCTYYRKQLPPKQQLMRVRQRYGQKYQRDGLAM